MFSANENLALRKHKRRVIQYVEECISEDVLDLGTTVMAMQVTCKAPGCVPLETAICIVFPRISGSEEMIPGLAQSKSGGTLKTKVLMPMVEVTKEDVLDALPPPLGRRTVEKLCVQARDVMLAQITQLMGDDDDFEGRKLMALYLRESLDEYMKRDCVAPEYGEPFPDIEPKPAALVEPVEEEEESVLPDENNVSTPEDPNVSGVNPNTSGL